MKDYFHPAFLLRLAIAIAYIAMSLFLFFLPLVRLPFFSKTSKTALAVLLFIYGLFRAYRAFQFKKEME